MSKSHIFTECFSYEKKKKKNLECTCRVHWVCDWYIQNDIPMVKKTENSVNRRLFI